MFKAKHKKTILYFVALVSIFIGAILYIVYRENTYISKVAEYFVDTNALRNLLPIKENKVILYYLPDFLWAFSLSAWLHIILKPQMIGSLLCAFFSGVYGAAYELLQYYELIKGTGDVVDIILYFSGGIVLSILYRFLSLKEKEKVK